MYEIVLKSVINITITILKVHVIIYYYRMKKITADIIIITIEAILWIDSSIEVMFPIDVLSVIKMMMIMMTITQVVFKTIKNIKIQASKSIAVRQVLQNSESPQKI